MHEVTIRTPAREVLVDISNEVEEYVGREAAGFDGMVHVFVPHTTAGVTVNEGADPSVARDLVDALARLVPREAGYSHREGNSDAHVKTSLMGSHLALPVLAGRLRLGTWQSVYLAEFDGPRSRRVWLQLTGIIERGPQ
jgi:secondary thiamine-phosphate synthase enzyme